MKSNKLNMLLLNSIHSEGNVIQIKVLKSDCNCYDKYVLITWAGCRVELVCALTCPEGMK